MYGVFPIQWVKSFREKGYFTQFFMTLVVSIPAINFGMLMGWLSPMAAVLQSPDGPSPEPVSDDLISWMVAVTFLPSIVSGIPAGSVADKWGRKITSMLTAFLLLLGWSFMLISLQPWSLLTSRVIAGTAGAGCYVVTPLYLKEIASDEIRGALGSLFILFVNLGYLIIYIIGDVLSFWEVLWICIAIPAAFLVGFIFMPETPVFLIKQGKIEKAREALAWLQNSTKDNKNIDEAIQQLEREEEEAKSMQTATWKSLVQDKTTFKAFRIAVTVMVAQETCGFLVVLMYAGSIFSRASESIGLELSPNKQTIVVGAIQVLGSIVASCIVEKTGRKWLLAGTAFVTGISMLTLGLWFYITSIDIWLPGWLPVVAMCMCIFADAAGLQPVPYVIMSELFSFQHRGMVTSFVASVCAISDFVQTKAYDPILKIFGIHWVFIIFSIVCFLVCLYTIIFIPETINKTVEELYAILEGKSKKEKKKDPEDKKETSYL